MEKFIRLKCCVLQTVSAVSSIVLEISTKDLVREVCDDAFTVVMIIKLSDRWIALCSSRGETLYLWTLSWISIATQVAHKCRWQVDKIHKYTCNTCRSCSFVLWNVALSFAVFPGQRTGTLLLCAPFIKYGACPRF